MFVVRAPSLTPDEFQDHYENKHIPLAYSLLGDAWPTTFHRRYLARITRKGFGGPANPDRPLLMLRGEMNGLDCDCVAELTFPSQRHFGEFYKKVYEKENAAVLAEDENRFLEQGKTCIIVVGETYSTGPDGVTTSDKNHFAQND
ncbi:hypothetical protein ACEQ8H_007675 [Pleosporales sp. CAS-2024a]